MTQAFWLKAVDVCSGCRNTEGAGINLSLWVEPLSPSPSGFSPWWSGLIRVEASFACTLGLSP